MFQVGTFRSNAAGFPPLAADGFRFKTEGEKREHVIKMNLLRRQLTPHAWGKMFERLCKVRGARMGQGSRNDRTSAPVAEVARELGVPLRTARLVDLVKITVQRVLG